jgi:biotin carboxyl carrier protein
MEKYRVFIRDKEYLIEIDGEKIFIDGEPYYAGIHFLNENGLFMVEKDEGKREFHIKSQDDGSYLVTTRGLQVDAVIESEKGTRKKRAEKVNTGEITAPIPGVVMDIKVVVGDIVEQNQVLVVLESMKMLMEFRAPFEGQIQKISVSKGQKLEKGDEMIRLEKEK